MCIQRETDLSQYFLPSLHIYVGKISLVNIGFNQTLKSLITFKQTLHYSALESVRKGITGKRVNRYSYDFSNIQTKKIRIKRNSSRGEMPKKPLLKYKVLFFYSLELGSLK